VCQAFVTLLKVQASAGSCSMLLALHRRLGVVQVTTSSLFLTALIGLRGIHA
jgi:hypothetical protein